MTDRKKRLMIIGGGVVVGILLALTIKEYVVSKPSSINKQSKSTSDEKQAIIDMLVAQGVSREKLEKEYNTKNGTTILGDALPVEEFKTLAEAEKSLGYYLGLHNTTTNLKGYSLNRVFMINNQFLQAFYNNEKLKKSFSVKTSKTIEANELISVYKNLGYNSEVIIKGVLIQISGENSDKLTLAYFNVTNGKNYSVYSESGFTLSDLSDLLAELIDNLQIMEDWQD